MAYLPKIHTIKIEKHPAQVTIEEIESVIGERISEQVGETETYCYGSVIINKYKTESGRLVLVENWYGNCGLKCCTLRNKPCVIIKVL